MIKSKVFFAFVLCSFSKIAAAEDCYHGAKTQSEMNSCAAAHLLQQETALKLIIEKILARPSENHELQKQFARSQVTWQTYRDQWCGLKNISRPASVNTMVIAECRAKITKDRFDQLNDELNCPEGDVACFGL